MEYKGYEIQYSDYSVGVFKNGNCIARFSTIAECQSWIDELEN